MDTQQDVLTTTTEEVASQAPSDEKMLSVDEVNRIVGREKAAAAEKARGQVEAKYAATTSGANTANQVDSEEVYEKVSRRVKADLEKEQQQAQQAQNDRDWSQVVVDYNKKLATTASSGDYEDFDEVVKGIDHSKYDFVVWGANGLDNTGDVMYELAKNPVKAVNLEALGRHDQKAFEREMKKLSDSIKANKSAAKTVTNAPEPYARLKPSAAGAAQSDTLDYAALKQKYQG